MKINNLLSLLYPNKLNEDNTSNLKTGDIVKVQILDIIDDIITFKGNHGETIEGRNESQVTYNKGETHNFIITNIEENKISIRPVTTELYSLKEQEIQITNNKNESSLINSKEYLIKLLTEIEVPITEKNIKDLEDTKKHYGKLADLISNNNIKNIENFTKVEVKELIKIILSDIDTNALSLPDEIKDDNLKKLFHLLKNVSLEDLAFMFKTSLDFNISNLKQLNSIFLGEDNITKNVNDLLNILQSKEIDTKHFKNITTVLNKLNISLENPPKINIKEFYDSILKELDLIKLNFKNNNGSEPIINKINTIKSSLDFLNKVNENITFIQIPVYINKHLQNCEIMIRKEKKDKKKFDVNNSKISISLNTNTFSLVRILIEIKNKNLYLNIRTKSSDFKKIVSKNEFLLSDKLKSIGYNNVFFKYNIDNDINSINHFTKLQKSGKNINIDVRV